MEQIKVYSLDFVNPPTPLEITFIVSVSLLLTAAFIAVSEFGGRSFLLSGKSSKESRKFAESCFNFVIYVILGVWGLSVLYQEPWDLETKNLFLGWPNHDMSSLFRYYYLFQLGFYIQQLVCLLFVMERKKDFFELLIHHIVTIALIAVSYYTWKIRFGLAILNLHDVSDIFLHLAKTLHYADKDNSTNVVFALFTVVFTVTRLYILPKILYLIWFQAEDFVVPQILEDNAVEYAFWKYFLLVLQVLHFFWYYYILKILVDSLSQQGFAGDARSDDESYNKKRKKE